MAVMNKRLLNRWYNCMHFVTLTDDLTIKDSEIDAINCKYTVSLTVAFTQ